jgi:hypothetical protein
MPPIAKMNGMRFRGIAVGGLLAWVAWAGACSSDKSGLTGVAGTTGSSGREGGTGEAGTVGGTPGDGGGGGTAGTAGAEGGVGGGGAIGGSGTGGRGGGAGATGGAGTGGSGSAGRGGGGGGGASGGTGGGAGAAGVGGAGGGAPVDEVESNDTTATANDFAAIAVGGRVSAAIGAAGDIDYFSITIPAGTGALYLTTFSSGVDTTCATANTTVSLINADGSTMLAINRDISSTQLCSHISYAPAPGTYFVRVNGNSSTAVFRYVLEVRAEVLPADAPETEPNDDGSPSIGDGMGTFEGNDFSAANANGPYSADTVIAGALTPVGDEDVFAIRNAGSTPAEVYLETFNGGFGSCINGLDTQIRIRDASGTVLAFDDDASTGRFCSFLPYVIPPTTTVYAHVIDFGDNTAAAAYWLHISFP